MVKSLNPSKKMPSFFMLSIPPLHPEIIDRMFCKENPKNANRGSCPIKAPNLQVLANGCNNSRNKGPNIVLLQS